MKSNHFSFQGFIKVYVWILSFLKSCKKQLVICLFCLLNMILLEVSIPSYIGKIIDGKENINEIYIIVFSMIVGILVFSVLFNFFSAFIQIKPIHVMQRKVFIKIFNLGIPFFEENEIGKILSLFNTNIDKISYMYKDAIFLTIRNIISLIFSMLFLCYIDWRFLIYVVVCYIPYLILAKFFSYHIGKCMERQVEIHKEYDSLLYEQFTMIEEFHMAGNETWVKSENNILYKRYTKMRIKTICYRYLRGMLFRMVSASGIIIYMYLMLNHLFLKEASIGTLISGIVYITNVFWHINGLIHTFTEQVNSVYYGKVIYDLLNHKEQKQEKIANKNTFEREIYLSNLSFTYNEKEKRGVFDVNLRIQKGEKVVIAGASGSGKTTLLKLISGEYSTYSGKIEMDGISYKKIEMNDMHGMIGYMLQETYLFSCSIKDNISIGDRSENMEQVIDAAKKAKIHDFIMSLPEQYDTIIQNKGSFLSGGQAQRIAFARILLKNPQIILLDEITSALDKTTKDEIMDTIIRIFKDKTLIVISHNKDELNKFDRIINVADGKIENHIFD